MAYIPLRFRKAVRQRANGQCEYCQAQELIGVLLVVDHIKPLSSGGETDIENLCLACFHCNSYKSDFRIGTDLETGFESPLFNPRLDRWSEHFLWAAAGMELTGLTPIGRATISRLRMNRPAIVTARRAWIKAGMHPPRAIT
ncbi:MAG: HNH endonuclease signature motif containing protein [Chloroflexi bacterium]|nr:HNH endonuclease signature motif containing protein [Chloroflexota bacterium]